MCMVFQKTANLHMPFRRPTTSVTIKIKIVTHAVAEKQQFRNQLSEQHVVRLRHRIEQLPLLLRHRLRYFRFRSPEHSCVNQHRQTAVMFDRHNQFRYSLPAIVTERALGTISQCFGLEHALFMNGGSNFRTQNGQYSNRGANEYNDPEKTACHPGNTTCRGNHESSIEGRYGFPSHTAPPLKLVPEIPDQCHHIISFLLIPTIQYKYKALFCIFKYDSIWYNI